MTETPPPGDLELLLALAADHGLELPHDPVGSVDTLREVVARLDGFIGSLAPGDGPTPG